MATVRIVGPGRAGRSLAGALEAIGVEVLDLLGRSDDLTDAARGVDLLLLTVPDRAIADVAAAVRPVDSTVVAHCSGALGLDALAPHGRVAALHPLVTLPDATIGAVRLRTGAFFVVAGDQLVTDVALALGGRPLVVPPEGRAAYHAAACMAANHVVALLGQVERVAATVGLPLEAFLPLTRGALDDVALLGPADALTGPAARGDRATIDRHLAALPAAELPGYRAGVALAERLAGGDALEPADEGDGLDDLDDVFVPMGDLAGIGAWR